jgi:hypothetical protein
MGPKKVCLSLGSHERESEEGLNYGYFWGLLRSMAGYCGVSEKVSRPCQNPVLKRRGMSILCYMCQTGWFTNAGRRRLEKLRRVLKPRMITILARNLL